MRVRINGCLLNLSAMTDEELAGLVDTVSQREREVRREATIVLTEVRRRMTSRRHLSVVR